MALSQAFKTVAPGDGIILDLDKPEPMAFAGADAGRDSIDAPRVPLMDSFYSAMTGLGNDRSAINNGWQDGLGGSGPKFDPSNKFLWAVSGYQSQLNQPPPAGKHFNTAAAADQNSGLQVDPAVLAEKINHIIAALDSAPPPEVVAYKPTTDNTNLKAIDQQTTAHAETTKNGLAAVQDINAVVAEVGKNQNQASGPSAAFASLAAGPALNAAGTALGGPVAGAALQFAVAAMDVAAYGAGTMGAKGHTSAYSDADGGGYSGASANTPSDTPASAQAPRPLDLPGMNHPGRVTIAGDHRDPASLATLQIDGMNLKDITNHLGTQNGQAQDMQDTMNQIFQRGFQVSAADGVAHAHEVGENQVKFSDTGTSAVIRPLNRGPSMG